MSIVLFHIHAILADTGIQFTNRQRDCSALKHMLAPMCQEHRIEHRLTKPNHPWTNGQVEWMNQPLKEATGQR